jgi:putative heme transporter
MKADRRVIAWTAIAVAAIGLTAVAWTQRRSADSLGATLGRLNPAYVFAAFVVEVGSLASLSRSQRHLIRAGGDQVTRRSALAVVFANNAMSVSVPLAGTGMGAAFSFRQFRRRGVRSATAGWALTVSNAMSALTFALLMTIGALTAGNHGAMLFGLSGAAVNALPVLILLSAAHYPPARRVVLWVSTLFTNTSTRLVRHPKPGAVDSFAAFLERTGSVHTSASRYATVFVHCLRNWTLDGCCLAFAILATGNVVPWHGFLLAYCTASMAGGVGLVPGGLGVVEATLTAGLVGAGVPAGRALTAVMLYRAISLWFVVSVGWLVAARLSRRGIDDPLPES